MGKQEELQYEQQEKRIQAQSDAFITLLTKRGILGDSQIDDAQKRAARQEKTKNCYHNTLMLLQHYRTLVWMLECFPETVAAELDRPFEGVDKLIEGNHIASPRSTVGAESHGTLRLQYHQIRAIRFCLGEAVVVTGIFLRFRHIVNTKALLADKMVGIHRLTSSPLARCRCHSPLHSQLLHKHLSYR